MLTLNQADRYKHSNDRDQSVQGKPLVRMLRSAWKRARIRAGLPNIRVHDLKKQVAGVSFIGQGLTNLAQ